MDISHLRLWPTREQWDGWKLPSKLTAIGAYISILALILSVAFFIARYIEPKEITPPPPALPGDTGWLLLGDFSFEERIFTRGPLYKVVKSNYPVSDTFPRKGEWIKLTVDRNVIIADFATNGLSKIFQPPWMQNILDKDDYTGVKLAKGSIVEVRDVSMARSPGMPAVLWVRIGYVPK